MDASTHQQANRLFSSYLRSGDPEALTQLFDAVSGDLLALAKHLSSDRSGAEDLVQDTFLAAIELGDSWDSERAVLPWLVGILANKARAARRRANRPLDPGRLPEIPTPDGLQAAQFNELKLEIRKAIAGLPPKDARLLADLLERGLAPRELAQEAGIAMGTMRVRMHRAFERLRSVLPVGFAGGGMILGLGGLHAVRRAIHKAAAKQQALTASGGAPTLSGIAPQASKASKAALALGGALVATATIAMMGGLPLTRPVGPNTNLASLGPATTNPSTDLVHARSTTASKRTPIAKAELLSSEVAVDLAKNSHRLILNVSGTNRRLKSPAVLRIRRWREAGATTLHIPVKTNGRMVIDVDSLFTNGPITPRDQISIYLRHPEYLDFGFEVPQARRGGKVVFSGELNLRQITTRLRGSIVLPDDMEASNRWVGFWPGAIPSGAHAVLDGLLTTETDAFGKFDLAIPGYSGGHLFIVVPGLGTLNSKLRLKKKSINDLGALQLNRGAELSGIALFDGRPLGRDVEIIATPTSSGSNKLFRSQGVRSVKGKVVHARISTLTDDTGYFKMDGLEKGISYRLAVANPVLAGTTFSFDPLEQMGSIHKAPARGLRLNAHLVPIRVLIHSGKVPIENAQLQFQFPKNYSVDPQPNHSQALYRRLRPCDERGLLSLAIPAKDGVRVHCTAHGYAPLTVTLTRSMVDRKGLLPIEMTPAVEGTAGSTPIQIAVQLTGPDAKTLEGTSVSLQLFDRDNGTIAVPPQTVRDSQLWFTGIPQGKYTFALRTGLNTLKAPSDLPYVRTRYATHYPLNSALLPDDGVLRIEHEVALGGRVKLRLEGYDGTPSPAVFELVKFSGYTRRPVILTLDEEGRGLRTATRCVGSGPFWLGEFIEAGPWTLRQVGPAYAETEVSLPLEMGKTTTLTFKLAPR